MSEEYVSLEVAKQLDDKGFDWKCDNRFFEKIPGTEREEWDENECAYVTKTKCNTYPKPTIQMFHKWLREKQAIYIVVKPHYSKKYEIIEFEYEIYSYDSMVIDKVKPIKSAEYYEDFNQCLNGAFLGALKLIEL